MFDVREESGAGGRRASGPPWILGHRGVPRQAPENTLSSLELALELGLDGFEYDLHACKSGEPVLLHDDTLDRTTDRSGPVAALTLRELAGADAGGWFSKRFRGEPLPLLDEALTITAAEGGTPRHMIEIKDPALVPEVARILAAQPRPLAVHVASFHRSVCLEARDRGLPTMLLALTADERDRVFVRDERIDAHGTAPGGWLTRAGSLEWDCERWSWSVDEPDDLLHACRAPLAGFNTNEPRRALATRELVALAPHDEGPYPLACPTLEVPLRAGGDDGGGEWSGRWERVLGVRNPFPFPVDVALALEIRGGAFETSGLPAHVRLRPGESSELPLRLAGGSWSPHDDPLVHAAFEWRHGPARSEQRLVLDAPLARVRTLALRPDALRLAMLRERPGDPSASMTLRRRGQELLAWVEDAGGLSDPQAICRIDSDVRTGGRGVRIRLPEDFDARPGGVAFALGFEGRQQSGRPRTLRRFCGGLPYGISSGSPGRLLPARA
jgi:glycerophosphoryl diester phosphodiesterase